MCITRFTVDASDFKDEVLLDPWNRKVPYLVDNVRRDPDGDVMWWEYRTSVAGTPVYLRVFND